MFAEFEFEHEWLACRRFEISKNAEGLYDLHYSCSISKAHHSSYIGNDYKTVESAKRAARRLITQGKLPA